MGAPLVLIRHIWPENGPKGPFSAKCVRFLFLHCRRPADGLKSVPIESNFEFLAILDLPLGPRGPLLQYLGDLRLRREFFFLPALLNISPKKKSLNLTPVGFQISLKLTPARFENGPNLTSVKF